MQMLHWFGALAVILLVLSDSPICLSYETTCYDICGSTCTYPCPQCREATICSSVFSACATALALVPSGNVTHERLEAFCAEQPIDVPGDGDQRCGAWCIGFGEGPQQGWCDIECADCENVGVCERLGREIGQMDCEGAGDDDGTGAGEIGDDEEYRALQEACDACSSKFTAVCGPYLWQVSRGSRATLPSLLEHILLVVVVCSLATFALDAGSESDRQEPWFD